MAQHDYLIDDGSGLVVRGDMNAVLAAIVSNNSGPEPAVKYAGMWWLDTSTDPQGILKLRNRDNSGWITLPTAGDYLLKTGGNIVGDLLVTGDFGNPEYDRLVGSHQGATAPSLPVPGMLWYDTTTTPAVMKVRNKDNNAWDVASPTVAPTFQNSVTVTQPAPGQNAYIDLMSQGETRKLLNNAVDNRMEFRALDGSVAAFIHDNGDLYLKALVTAPPGLYGTGMLSAALSGKQAALGFIPVRQATADPYIQLNYVAPTLYLNVGGTGGIEIYTSGKPPPLPTQVVPWTGRGVPGSVTFAWHSGTWTGNTTMSGASLRYGYDDGHDSVALPGTWRNLGGNAPNDKNTLCQRIDTL